MQRAYRPHTQPQAKGPAKPGLSAIMRCIPVSRLFVLFLLTALTLPFGGHAQFLNISNTKKVRGVRPAKLAVHNISGPRKGSPSELATTDGNAFSLPALYASLGIQDTNTRYFNVQRNKPFYMSSRHQSRILARQWLAAGQNTAFRETMLPANYASHLADALTYPTISADSMDAATAKTFTDFHAYLQRTYPRVHAILQKEVVDKYSLLYVWKGSNPKLKPILLLAHMDVVPVEKGTDNQWDYPAFAGAVNDSFIYGRGAADDKLSVIGIMEAVESLLRTGFHPQRDIYIAFGHDEETEGEGARTMSALLASRGLSFEYVLDEGGSILEGILPEVKTPTAFVSVAEKGYLTLELSASEANGGHSSAPVDEGVVGILGRAIYRLQENPFHSRLIRPMREMFRVMSHELGGVKGFVAARPRLFAGLLKKQLASNPITVSLMQTTIAPTVIEGGVKDNVMPTSARMLVNFRIMPGENINSVIKHVTRAVNDPRVQIKVVGEASNPPHVTSIKSRSYKTLKKTIEQVYPGITVAPALNVSTSDSRSYANLTNNVLRFVPMRQKPSDLSRIHGKNERISREDFKEGVHFYYNLILNSDALL